MPGAIIVISALSLAFHLIPISHFSVFTDEETEIDRSGNSPQGAYS